MNICDEYCSNWNKTLTKAVLSDANRELIHGHVGPIIDVVRVCRESMRAAVQAGLLGSGL